MKIQIEATPHIVKFDGVECRLWEGTTEGGIPCKVFIHRLAVHKYENSEQFEEELIEKMPPGQRIDLRQVM